MTASDLIRKYDVPAPRYTSYPTVPYWENSPTPEQWIEELKKASQDPSASWAMYIHVPYCETLCTFCGCNNTITKDHNKEGPYVELILQEFENYKKRVPELFDRPLEEIHLGGGTPTFLSADHLVKLISPILRSVPAPGAGSSSIEASIEVDPRRTKVEQLVALRELGFTRISMGVQDFNPEVQRLVNRIQPYDVTARLTQIAREMGFKSVNYDLIYGLPRQTLAGMHDTMGKTIALRPDRIALYSYAHVPWIKAQQRLFTENDLPHGEEKRKLYELSREALASAGYVEIGMDHFALSTDSLYIADQERTLHRNFMGYTHRRTSIMLGLGVSAISETPTCFHQNEKVLPVYERRVGAEEIPTFRGHLLNDEDRTAREQILGLMTRWETKIEASQIDDIREVLEPLEEDGLVKWHGHLLKMTPEGRPFLRNACMALDRRMRRKSPGAKIFSQAL